MSAEALLSLAHVAIVGVQSCCSHPWALVILIRQSPKSITQSTALSYGRCKLPICDFLIGSDKILVIFPALLSLMCEQTSAITPCDTGMRWFRRTCMCVCVYGCVCLRPLENLSVHWLSVFGENNAGIKERETLSKIVLRCAGVTSTESYMMTLSLPINLFDPWLNGLF